MHTVQIRSKRFPVHVRVERDQRVAICVSFFVRSSMSKNPGCLLFNLIGEARVYGVLLYNVSQHLADDCNCLIFKQLLEVPLCPVTCLICHTGTFATVAAVT